MKNSRTKLFMLLVVATFFASCATMGRVNVTTSESLDHGTSTIYSTQLVHDTRGSVNFEVRVIRTVRLNGVSLYNLFVRLDSEGRQAHINQLLIMVDETLFTYTLEPTVSSRTSNSMSITQRRGPFSVGFGTLQHNFTERATVTADQSLVEALLNASSVRVQISGAEMRNAIVTLRNRDLMKLQKALAQIEAK